MTTFQKLFAHTAFAVVLTATALPASAASAVSHSCAPDADATIRTMIPADTSPLAQAQALSGTAIVQFDLDASGSPHNAAVIKSTGWAVLDRDARKAAVAQVYAPRVRACQTVADSYRVVVEFTDDAR